MPSGYSKKPNPPSHKRRYPLDFYELVFFSIFTIFFMLIVGIISGLWYFSDIDPDQNIIGVPIMAWCLVGFILCSIVLYLFDRAAVKRQKEKFDFDLKEYEILRSKWIELEARSMEQEKLTNNNTFFISKQEPVSEIVQPVETETHEEES